ncbi:hypothetical protein PHAVU_010G046000 [Phaseolus vulgaris]
MFCNSQMAAFAKSSQLHAQRDNPLLPSPTSTNCNLKAFTFTHNLHTLHPPLRKVKHVSVSSSAAATTSLSNHHSHDANSDISQLCLLGNLDRCMSYLDSMHQLRILVEDDTYVALVRLCEWKGARKEGSRVYSYVSMSRTLLSLQLGNALLSMFVRFGNLVDAWYVFGRMEKRNLFSWNVLIGGYAKAGFFDEALDLYHRMLWVGERPDVYTFPCVLRTCGGMPNLMRGREIHVHVVRNGFESDVDVLNALITMYVKCGDVSTARLVFEKMSNRDRISWNAMISGYFENGECLQGLRLFVMMIEYPVDPDLMTMISVITACELLGDERLGREIHGYVLRMGFGRDPSVQNSLIQMYSSVGHIQEAETVFSRTEYRDVVSWTAMISGYENCLMPQKALETYKIMEAEGVMPNEITIATALSACSGICKLDMGTDLHEAAKQTGLISHPIVGMKVTKLKPKPNVSSIKQHINLKETQQLQDAAKMYAYMRRTDTEVDNFIIPSVLKACSLIPSILLGQELHGFVVKNGFHGDVFVCNALIMMYSEAGSLASARLLFDKIENKDIVSWSTMIRSYDRSGLFNEALNLFRDMLVMGVRPSEIAMISITHVLAKLADLKTGKAMHGYVIRNVKYGKSGVSLSTSLIDMYVKCGNLAYAIRLFDGLSEASIISWTTMIAGYIHCNNLNEGVRLFVKMLDEGMFPNDISILSLVKECGTVGALELGKWLHAFTLRSGFTMSLVLATAFIDMYGKCGDARIARSVFSSFKGKDFMMWSAMISAYAQNNCINEAFDIFIQMTSCGIRPNEITMVSLLRICAKAGSLEMGKWIHSYIDKQGIKEDMILKTSLVNMYAKCGDIDAAHRLFDAVMDRDILMWNAMISGFAMHGHGEAALKLFEKMEALMVVPNDITFIGALYACSHSGLLHEGRRLFHKMVHEFGVVPKVEHYGCMVDLLGRAGMLDEAKKLIENMPMKPNMVVFGSLLSACKLHKNLKLGEWIAEQFLSLEHHKSGYNVLMSNIYASESRWGDVAHIRRGMKDEGIVKVAGVSSIEVNGSLHEFIMGDRDHPDAEKIYEMIGEMREKLEDVGYTPDVSCVLMNMDNEEKETALNYHSEKLAMAYGLISTAPGVPIRIVKNLRICDDCHNATKLLSKIYGREIIVRDRNRFHHFQEGYCSCCDYW